MALDPPDGAGADPAGAADCHCQDASVPAAPQAEADAAQLQAMWSATLEIAARARSPRVWGSLHVAAYALFQAWKQIEADNPARPPLES